MYARSSPRQFGVEPPREAGLPRLPPATKSWPSASSDCPEQNSGAGVSATPSPSRSIRGASRRESPPVTGSQSQNCDRFSRLPPSNGGRPQNATFPVGSSTALMANVGSGIVAPSQRPTASAAASATAARRVISAGIAARAAACSAAWRGPSVAISYGVCAVAGAAAQQRDARRRGRA